jgi:hypothetical protein
MSKEGCKTDSGGKIMRLRHFVPPLVVLVALLAIAPDAMALRSAGLGGKVGLVSPDVGDNEIVFGFHWLFEQENTLWRFSPELMFWSADQVSDIILNVNAYYDFMPHDRISPYAGAGLGLHIYDFDVEGIDNETDLALNLLGGVRGPAFTAAEWFAEARYVITDNEQMMFLVGMTFIIGRGGGGASAERETSPGY